MLFLSPSSFFQEMLAKLWERRCLFYSSQGENIRIFTYTKMSQKFIEKVMKEKIDGGSEPAAEHRKRQHACASLGKSTEFPYRERQEPREERRPTWRRAPAHFQDREGGDMSLTGSSQAPRHRACSPGVLAGEGRGRSERIYILFVLIPPLA